MVRASANMADVTAIQSATEAARYVGGTVVGHDSLDARDSLSCEEALRAFEEADRGYAFLVGQEFGESQTRGIVDGDVDKFPTDTASTDVLITVDAMSDHADSSQRLHIEMDELARPLALIAMRSGLGRLEQRQPRQSHALKHRGHRRSRHPQRPGDLPPGQSPSAQRDDLMDPRLRNGSTKGARSRSAVDQTRF